MVSAFEGCQAYNRPQNPFTTADLAQAVRTLIDFLLFSSLFMGMQGMGMVYTSCVIQGLEPTPAVLAIMLLVPFSVYNMNRKTDEEEDSVNHPGRYQFTKRFEKPLEYGALVTYALAVLIAVPYGFDGSARDARAAARGRPVQHADPPQSAGVSSPEGDPGHEEPRGRQFMVGDPGAPSMSGVRHPRHHTVLPLLRLLLLLRLHRFGHARHEGPRRGCIDRGPDHPGDHRRSRGPRECSA